jgi:acyl-CoA thioesterase FadM
MHFRYATTITLFDTDASGLLFYGSLFRLTQSCFETFLREKGLPIARWITGDLPALPVRKVYSEYQAPLRAGAHIVVSITDISIGTTSLTVTYSVVDTETQTECATATITHVALDRSEKKSIPLPAEVAKLLSEGAS